MVGISDHAQEALGEIVYVDLPKVGEIFEQGDAFSAVESVKAASDVYMPVSGEIIEVKKESFLVTYKKTESWVTLTHALYFQKNKQNPLDKNFTRIIFENSGTSRKTMLQNSEYELLS